MALPWAKHYRSMYDGSMAGSGAVVFAVWGYAISTAVNGKVRLHPVPLGRTIGEDPEEIVKAIEKLQSKDKFSHHKEHGGARLVQLEEEFIFFIPSWQAYQQDAKKAAAAEASKRHREKKSRGQTAEEREFVRVDGDNEPPEDVDELTSVQPPFGWQST